MTRWRDDLAYVAGLILGLAVLFGFGFADFREKYVATDDFSYIWLGSRVVLDGGDPYGKTDWPAAVERYGVQRGPEAFYVYPPHVALALVPVGALPLGTASKVWTGGGMVLAALALRSLLRIAAPGRPVLASLAGFALFVSQPGVTSFWSGQWTFLLVAGLAWGAACALGARASAGAAALLLLGKPHLFVLAGLGIARALVAAGRARLAAVLGAAAALVVIVPLALFPRWLSDEIGDLGSSRLAGQRSPTTLPVALHDLFGETGTVLAFVVIIASLVLLVRLDARRALAATCALSLVTVPYSWSYDQLVLVVPLAITCAALTPLAGAIAFTAFLLVPALLYVIASARDNESFQAFVPLAVFVLAIVVALRERHRIDVTRG